jgi:hypothetical protein
MKVSQLRKLIKETINEMEIDEMARTVGTGGGVKITDAGKQALKRIRTTNEMPAGLKKSGLDMLIWLFKTNGAGERAQVADYAELMFDDRKAQPRVNPIFNELKSLGFAEKEGYISALPGVSGTPKSKLNPASMVDDLDFGDLGDDEDFR